MKIELGSKVRDLVTGFVGIATCRSEYLNGCIQYLVEGRVGKDGKKAEYAHVDEGQLEIIDAGLNKKVRQQPKKTDGGGMRITPPKY